MSLVHYFIHTNEKQLLPAKVSQYNSMKNHSSPRARILKIEDYIDVNLFHNKTYLRNGIETSWNKADLQSFTLLRFIIPELSNYEGISIVTDPDVFLMKPFNDILKKYQEHDLTVRRVINASNRNKNYLESSIMIFRNERFRMFNFKKILEMLFTHEIDYKDLIHLDFYIKNGIKIFEADEHFNSFDKFDENTEFLHTTNRITQPWKTGLNIDFKKYKFDYGETNKTKIKLINFKDRINHFIFPQRYKEHPDKNITDFFDKLFIAALNDGHINMNEVKSNIYNKYISKKYLTYLD